MKKSETGCTKECGTCDHSEYRRFEVIWCREKKDYVEVKK